MYITFILDHILNLRQDVLFHILFPHFVHQQQMLWSFLDNRNDEHIPNTETYLRYTSVIQTCVCFNDLVLKRTTTDATVYTFYHFKKKADQFFKGISCFVRVAPDNPLC